jgi:hypothetical protein
LSFVRFAESLRFKLCAKCRSNDIHDWHGAITFENEQLWEAATTDEMQRFRQARFGMHCLILGTLMIPATIMFVVWITNR